MANRLKAMIDEAIVSIEDFIFDVEQEDGKPTCLSYSHYADYNDRYNDETIAGLLDNDDPEGAFYNELEDDYHEWECHVIMEAADDVEGYIKAHAPNRSVYRRGLTLEERRTLIEYIRALAEFDFTAVENHYYAERYKCDLTIDVSKDSKHDYHYNDGEYNYDLSSVLWLVEQQGYAKDDLDRILNDPSYKPESKFLKSIQNELANVSSNCNTLTVLANISLGELFKINDMVKEYNDWFSDKDGYGMESNWGTVTIDKGATVGLVDFVCGGGSLIEIELEKDLVIPTWFIKECIPDAGYKKRGCFDCSIDSIYSLWGGMWKESLENIAYPDFMKLEGAC